MVEKETTMVETPTEEKETKLPSTEENYLDIIKRLRENTVDRETYEKAVAENKKLLESVLNGEQMAAEEQEEKVPVDLGELRKELFSGKSMTNLDFITKTLQLREGIIEKGGIDPFLPVGTQVTITDDDIQKADLVAKVFKECVDYANGDPQVFTNELQRRTANK